MIKFKSTLNSIHCKLNNFLNTIKLKKQYIEKLKDKKKLVTDILGTNHKKFDLHTEGPTNSPYTCLLVVYIVSITFAIHNTYFHITDSEGVLKFFCSAGTLGYKGKRKKSRLLILKDFSRILVSKLKFLKEQPVALHLKNVTFDEKWVVRLLKKKLVIHVVKSFTSYPYNGCRGKKVRRKKIKN